MPELPSDYEERLDALLDLAPLLDETRDRPGVRVRYQPSFDAEVVVTAVGGPAPKLSVVALSGSLWYHLVAASMPELPEGMPRPAQPRRLVAVVPLAERDAEGLLAIAREALPLDRASPEHHARGLDGMPVTIQHAEAGRQVAVERWSPGRDGDGPEQLAIALFLVALREVQEPTLREALRRLGGYVSWGDDA